MPFRPAGKVAHRREQGLAHRGERVVHPGWHDRVHGPRDEAVPLETAQCHGEHALADPVDVVKKLGEAAAALAQAGDHEYGPLVADAHQHLAHLPRRTVLADGGAWDVGYLRV